MKINIFSKKVGQIIPWLICIFLSFCILKKCNSIDKHEKVKINNPEIKGKFEPVKEIEHKPVNHVADVSKKVSNSTALKKYQNDISQLYNENEALKKAFFNETDSLKREILYLKAIQLNEFYHTFDNDTINITVKGIVQGEVKSLQPFYVIKERKEIISIPVVKFRLTTGFGVGFNKELNQALYKLNVGFENSKGNTIRGSYMRIGPQQYGILEYDFSVFKK
jgi:hypothetical protein